MRDENFCTIGGRITHPPGIYQTPSQGYLLSIAIAHHTDFPTPNTTIYFDVKVGGASDRMKLEEFANRLTVGRRVTIHVAQLQQKRWAPSERNDTKTSFYLFCQLDKIFLHEPAKKPDHPG